MFIDVHFNEEIEERKGFFRFLVMYVACPHEMQEERWLSSDCYIESGLIRAP